MENIKKLVQEFRNGILYVLAMVVTLFVVFRYETALYGVFGEKNYITLHILVQILVIFFSLAIAIQAWLSFKFNNSSRILQTGAVFLIVGVIEIAHTLTYEGMPYFGYGSNSDTSTWLYLISRLTLVLGLIWIYIREEREVPARRRYVAYTVSVLYTVAVIGLVASDRILPSLSIGQGKTIIESNLEFTALTLQIVFIALISKILKMFPKRYFYMVIASLSLIVSDIMYSTTEDVYGITSLIGHLFQVVGFQFLFRAIFYAAVEKPFVELRQANESLQLSEQQVRKHVYYDAVTGLPNERYLVDYMKEHLHDSLSRKAVFVFGIERYSIIKKSLGSKNAAQLLVLITQRFQANLPYEYTLCKLSEDRYAMFIQNQYNAERMVQLSERLQELMEEPFEMEHFSIATPLQIGVSIYPKDATVTEDLIQYAQFAADESAKTTDKIAFFEASMLESRAEKILLEQDLKKAIEQNELFLEYQPQMDLRTGEIQSTEALIRWRHPEKGLMAPFHFIPVAEESGLIVPIGQWVLETACAQTVAWQQHHQKPLKVAVNLSMGQLYQKDFVLVVQQTLQKTGLSPQHLQLEITESMTININQIIPVLEQLRALGVTIAVDDFGTGYSSLSYLKNFPIDCLKIDRSFIQNILTDPNDEALVQMILSMAQHLKLKVVAEGIETFEQLHYLSHYHCDKIQGYYISKPVAFDYLLTDFGQLQSFAAQQYHCMKVVV